MSKTRNNKAFAYFEVFLLVMLTVGPIPSVFKALIYFAIIVGYFLFFRLKIDVNYMKAKMKLPIAIIICIVVAMIIDLRNIDLDSPYSMAGFAYLLPFVLCLLLVRKYNFESFVVICERVLFFLCICSLIGFGIQTLNRTIILRFPSFVFYDRLVYTSILYNAVPDYTATSVLMRNCGCAYEPGAFQFLMNLGIALCFKFLGTEKNKKTAIVIRIIFYSIAVITTFSTVGLLILAVLFLINSLNNWRIFLLTAVIMIVFYQVFINIYQTQMIKLVSGNFDFRFDNSLYVLENYWSYFFGVGSTGYDRIYAINRKIGSWDLYTNLFLRFGYPFIILFFINLMKTWKISVSVFLVLFISFFTESILGPIPVILMLFSLDLPQSRRINRWQPNQVGALQKS